MNGIIIYKGKYGATRQYADWLSEELNLPAMRAGSWGDKELPDCDYIILGSSVYIGKLQLKKWVEKNASQLMNKKIFLFVVCGTPANETEKLAGYMHSSVPPALLKNCAVFYLPGRLIYKELSFPDKFLLNMGARLMRDAKSKKTMLTDYDNVKKEHLGKLMEEVRKFMTDRSVQRDRVSS